MPEISTKPYLLRAIYEWCTDNGYTPYLAAMVDSHTRVPREFVKDGEIVLNISFTATSGLKMDNDLIHFSARFGGVARDIVVPVENVVAIYARENGQGMAFPMPTRAEDEGKPATPVQLESAPRGLRLAQPPSAPTVEADSEVPPQDDDAPDTPPPSSPRPALKRIM